jgi:hypothetical protein
MDKGITVCRGLKDFQELVRANRGMRGVLNRTSRSVTLKSATLDKGFSGFADTKGYTL